jgi:hypothetical protein
VIEVHDGNGTLIDQNDDWEDFPDLPALVDAMTANTGFLPNAGSTDAAVLLTLPQGRNTAIIRGKGDDIGVALLEVYFIEFTP